jgi:hypothetical protein
MTNKDYKKYTKQAKAGIKGEAFFEALISDYALPHHIVGSKDLGIDYICEWVYGDRPTGFLFGVQVKTFSRRNLRLRDLGQTDYRNNLHKYEIEHNQLDIKIKTQSYWRGLGMPIYLFAIVYSESDHNIDCFYKRFTRALTTPNSLDENGFYKVNDGTTFLAFADQESKKHGFARDLFVDTIRVSYYKGYIPPISPRSIGLEEFPENNFVFGEVIQEYREIVCQTYIKTRKYLEVLCEDRHTSPKVQKTTDSSVGSDTSAMTPSAEIPEDE